MSNDEIKSLVEFNDFENPQQEYARNIWLLLYRCNGMNYADMFRMRWSNIVNGCLVFTRMKTEETCTVNVKDIVVPIGQKIQSLIDQVGVKDSSYILGLLNEDYQSEQDFNNKKDWESSTLNSNLKIIGQKLTLSVDLQLCTARDCFATTLKRAGYPKDVIGEMMGHGNNYISTSHYLAHVDTDKLREIGGSLF
jgi:site-specific recombinase XerD